MKLGARRRTAVLPRAVAVPTLALLLGALAACSVGGRPAPAAASRRPAPPSAPATYNPLAGPVEPAAQLPKSCSKILTDRDLTAAFGAPQVGDTSYGNYAPLPSIGRTGRVTCGFVIGVDPSGHPEPAGVIVSVITYDTAVNAANRVARNVRDTVAGGATAQPVLVAGHPATILVEPAPTAAPSAASSPPGAPAPSASASAPVSGGDTELLMADGNRTFVVTIPMSSLSGSAAVTTLVNIMTLVYQHTLPSPGSSAPSPSTPPQQASSSTAASPSATASPSPSTT